MIIIRMIAMIIYNNTNNRTQIKNIVTHLIDDGGDTIKNGLLGRVFVCWFEGSFFFDK